jgi:hypothetical protein
MTTKIINSLSPSDGIDDSKNQFHNRIDLSKVIDSMELMPRILKSLKIWALEKLLVSDAVTCTK